MDMKDTKGQRDKQWYRGRNRGMRKERERWRKRTMDGERRDEWREKEKWDRKVEKKENGQQEKQTDGGGKVERERNMDRVRTD